MKDCIIRNRAAKPSSAATRVYNEQAQGLRRRSVRLVLCPSIMLSDVMSFAGGPGAGSVLSLVMVLGWRRVVADRCNGTCPSSPLLVSVHDRGPAAIPSDPSFTASTCSKVRGLAMLGPGTICRWPRPGFRPVGGDGRI